MSSARKRPDPSYFLDRMLSGSRIADAMKASGLDVEVIEEHHYDPKTTDAEWLTTVGQRGWIALTRDQDIKRSPLTLEAIRATRAKMFCLTADNLDAEGLAGFITKFDPLLREVARAYKGPFVANIDRYGHIWFVRGGAAIITFTPCTEQRRAAHQLFTKAGLRRAKKKKAKS